MDRQIVCFAIPSFEVALARLNDPALRTRPLAIAPLTPPVRCSVKSPSKLYRKVSMSECRSNRRGASAPPCTFSHRILIESLLRTKSLLVWSPRYAPVWEPFHPGSFMMDLTGTTRLFGTACDVAAQGHSRTCWQRYHLEGVAGVGSNKLVAQTAATLIEPSELYDVRHGSERRLYVAALGTEPCQDSIDPVCGRWLNGSMI